jgi:hypothetical protein
VVASATASPYYFEHFNGVFNTGIIRTQGGNTSNPGFSFVSGGSSGQGARLNDCSASSPGICSDGTAVGSSSTYGQLTFVGTDCNYLHAGWASGTCSGGNGKVEEQWTRFRVRFGSGYFRPVPRQQDTFWEMHVDPKTASLNANVGSDLLKVAADDNGTFSSTCSGTPYFCTKQGLNPRLALQVCGGDLATASMSSCGTYQLASGSLLFDHWYDIVLRFVYSPDATVGRVQWWVDGALVANLTRPTVYRRPDGTLSYGSVGGFYNYRYWANYMSDSDFDEWEWGPSAASVGFNPA